MSNLSLPPTRPEPSDPMPPPPELEPPAPPIEDSSSQALSEALGSSFRLIRILMLGLVLIFVCSGVFVVQPNEVAILLRFGKPVGTGAEQQLKPGWHWAFPYPIDEPVKIKIGQIETATSVSGWYATTPEMEAKNEEPQARGYLSPDADGYVITADGNIVHARATIKYRVTDPLRFIFAFTNATETLTNIINNALFYASAQTTAESALYKDKAGFRDRVIERVRAKADEVRLGINIEPSEVETKAPVDVREAFEKVNATEQERSKLISDAQGYHDEITRKAVGEGRAIVSGGIVSSNRAVQTVAALADAFNQSLPSYQQNPNLFKQRLLATTMEKVLTTVRDKYSLPQDIDELRLQLSREPEKRETKEQP